MKPAVLHLTENRPAWFSIEESNRELIVGRAHVPRTPWAKDGLHLHIAGFRDPRAREKTPGTNLPARCAERHIQGDRTFCVGLHAIDVDSASRAHQWWSRLEQFITCQGVAELTRVWPVRQALDHGDAGKHHERALALAREAGISEEYELARLGEPSWITDRKLHIFGKKGRPINGRALCPRGCTKRARGRIVRTLRVDCDKRQLLVDLTYAEELRRRALTQYWQSVIASGEKCCRTMRGCPLAAHEDLVRKGGEEKA